MFERLGCYNRKLLPPPEGCTLLPDAVPIEDEIPGDVACLESLLEHAPDLLCKYGALFGNQAGGCTAVSLFQCRFSILPDD